MSHARVPTIDPDGQREGDAGAIPLSSLRPPHAPPLRQASDESFGGPPPAHYAHPHGFDNPNYFEGYDVGNQPREEDLNAPSASASGSGSSASRQNEKQGWGKFDTYVGGREQALKFDEGHAYNEKAHFQGAALQEDGLPHQIPGGHHDDSSDDETDDFNWSSDEDDPDTVVEADGTKRIRAKRGRRIYMSLMNLARPIRIFILGLLGSAIALVPFIVVLTAFPTNSARPQVEVWSIWIAIIWAAACGTFLVLNWVPTLLEKSATAIWGKVPASFAKYVEVVKATLVWAKLMLCIAWAWISLGGIIGIEFGGQNDEVRPAYFHYVFLTLQALFGSSVIIYVEKLCLRLIATNFHKIAVADRLDMNQKALKALDRLHESEYVKSGSRDQSRRATGNWASKFGFGSRPASPGPNTPGHRANKSSVAGAGYFGSGVTQPGTGSGSKTPHQRTHRKDGSGNKTPTMDVQTGQQGAHSGRRPNFASQLSEALTTAAGKKSRLFQGRKARSQQSARKLARKLFYNLGHHRDTLVAEDFYPYFKTTEEAREAFGFFDADNNGDISKAEMRDAVQRIYREKRALAVSLRDMGSAVSKLDGVLMFLALIIMVFIWLLIFNRDSTVANIVPLSTFVVGFSFVFGNSAKTIFESMIFIFATHPYDVGDLVCVDENWMFVESFGMLSTTFRTVTNQYIVAPNAMLASQKYIFNSRRSGATWEVTMIQVGFDTLIQLIDEFRARMRQFVKENDREWGGGLEVNYDRISNQNAVQLVIAMEHKGNWQDWGARWARRTKLMRHVKTVCEELGIVYQLPPQPVTFHPRSGRAPFQPTMSAKTSFMSPRAAPVPGASAAGAEGGGGQGGGSFIPVGFTQAKKKEDESS